MKTKKCNLSLITLVALSLILTNSPCRAYFGENSNQVSSSGNAMKTAIIACSVIVGIGVAALAISNFFGKDNPSKEKVTYNANGATSGSVPIDATIYDKGAQPKALRSIALARPGFRFAGWIDPNTGKIYKEGESIDPLINSIGLDALWVASITYKDTSGATGNPPVDSNEYVEGKSAIVLDKGTLNINNFFFQGWSKINGANNPQYAPGDPIIIDENGNVTLYSVWNKKPCHVMYYGNGETEGAAPEDDKYYNKSESAIVLGNIGNSSAIPLSKTNFQFSGWSNNPNASKADYVAGNLTPSLQEGIYKLYAIWTCNIQYDANNATTGQAPIDNKSYINNSQAIIANQNNLTKEGYYFGNWSNDKNVTNTSIIYKPGDIFNVPGNTTFYAVWNAKRYSITYDTNNVTGNVIGNIPETKYYDSKDKNITLYDNNNAPIPLTNPGLVFSGWSIDPDAYVADNPSNIMSSISNNTQYYAVWTCNITYNGNGNDGGTAPIDNRNYTYNSTATLKDGGNLTKTNYHIDKWKHDNSDITYNLSQNIQMNKSLVLNANWILNNLTITYHNNSASAGSAPKDGRLYNIGDNATILNSTLLRNNATLLGWSTDPRSRQADYIFNDSEKGTITFQSENISLYPVWGAQITYKANGAEGDVPVDNENYVVYNKAIVKGNIGNLTMNGRYFYGWNDISSSYSVYMPGDLIKVTTKGNIILGAIWGYNPLYVIYNGNGNTSGTSPIDSNRYQVGSVTKALNNTDAFENDYFKKNKCHFFEWNTNANGKGISYKPNDDITINNASNLTLYAIWQNDSVTYSISNLDNITKGEAPTDIKTYKDNEQVTIATDASFYKTNFTVLGWSLNPNDTKAMYKPDEKFTFYSAIAPYNYFAILGANVIYLDGGASSGTPPVDPNSYSFNTNTVALGQGNLTKAGSYFHGWSDGFSTYAPGDLISIGSNGNKILTATWSNKAFFVTYNGNGNDRGTAPVDPKSYDTGENATVLNISTDFMQNKFHFSEWRATINNSPVSKKPDEKIRINNSNVSFYAAWEGNNITYDGNLATSGFPLNDEHNYSADVGDVKFIVGGNSNFYKTNFTFINWSLEGSVDITYDPGQEVPYNKSKAPYNLFARWGAIVTYNNSSGDCEMPTDETKYLINSNVMIKKPMSTSCKKNDYSFAGWGISPSDTNITYFADNYTSIQMNLNLYALYGYTVMYNVGQDSCIVQADNNLYLSGSLATIKTPSSCTKDSLPFAGWGNSSDDASITYFAESNVEISDNLSLYPLYGGYTVTYDDNYAESGTPPVDIKVYAYNGSVTVLGKEDLVGINGIPFNGWALKDDGTGISYAVGSTFKITKNITLYANWVKVGGSYGGGTVIYIGNGTNDTTDPKKILIMANEDQTNSTTGPMDWSTYNPYNYITNATYGYHINNNNTCRNGYTCNTIGSGQLNVMAISSTIGLTHSPAASVAANCTDGNNKDWYFPSMWELNVMYNYAANNTNCGCSNCNNYARGNFSCNDYYWSSTEWYHDSKPYSQNAWAQSFSNGTQDNRSKGKFLVRAVRSVSYP